MFTGIIEEIGLIKAIEPDGTNIRFTISSPISHLLKVDQSVSHDGVCLTIVDVTSDTHTVDAIKETIDKTNLSEWQVGRLVNLERAMSVGQRLDGHMVQGHVDCTAICIDKKEMGGSWNFTFKINQKQNAYSTLLVEKGSICINGISLTVVNPDISNFSVAIIPYTYNHTNMQNLAPGQTVNIEFDILGKYIQRHIGAYMKAMKG